MNSTPESRRLAYHLAPLADIAKILDLLKSDAEKVVGERFTEDLTPEEVELLKAALDSIYDARLALRGTEEAIRSLRPTRAMQIGTKSEKVRPPQTTQVEQSTGYAEKKQTPQLGYVVARLGLGGSVPQDRIIDISPEARMRLNSLIHILEADNPTFTTQEYREAILSLAQDEHIFLVRAGRTYVQNEPLSTEQQSAQVARQQLESAENRRRETRWHPEDPVLLKYILDLLSDRVRKGSIESRTPTRTARLRYVADTSNEISPKQFNIALRRLEQHGFIDLVSAKRRGSGYSQAQVVLCARLSRDMWSKWQDSPASVLERLYSLMSINDTDLATKS